MQHLDFIEGSIGELEREIAARLKPHQEIIARLCTIPGIDLVSAWGIISEVGLDMGQFVDAEHLASWAALCPGNRLHPERLKRKLVKRLEGLGFHVTLQPAPSA